jgi:ornithine cyclodeaminase/alanine dehydrogenase-like protein (mu-crystallin family)
MALLLTDEQVRGLLTIDDLIAAMEEAYAELAAGRGIYRVRTDMIAATDRPDDIFALKSMDGVIPKFGVGTIRVNSDTLRYRRDGDRLRRDRVPADDEGRYVGFVMVFSTETGELLMVYPDGAQSKRVASISALGIRHVGRKTAGKVALIGSGVQARAQVEVMEIDSMRCYSTSPERRETFAGVMSQRHGLDIRPAASAEEAVKGADVVLCATNSRSHVFFQDWLEPGMHVSCINMFELESPVVKAAEIVGTHIRECDPIFIKTAGIGVLPEEPGAGFQNLADDANFASLPTIGEFIAGEVPGRTSDNQITCMINSVGCGYQFAVLGYVLNRCAREQGVGHEIPSDWFTTVPEA